jgi:hypothetical protein
MEMISEKSPLTVMREIIEGLKKKLAKKNASIIWRVVTLSQPKTPGIYNGLLAGIERGEPPFENMAVTLTVKNIAKLSIDEDGWKWKRQSYYEGKYIRDEGIPIVLDEQACFLLTEINDKKIELYCSDLMLRRDRAGILPPAAFSATIDF